jgi:hypothetical protein
VTSTNYFNCFIAVADDCPVTNAEIPKSKNENNTIAEMQFEMIFNNPYKYSSDDVIFGIFATRNDISENELAEAKSKFFSKGQPCMRSSALAKRYGWGVHNNSEGKIAIFAIESEEYQKLLEDNNLQHTKAMRSKRV